VKLVLSGVNHRSAPLALRERFAVADPIPWLEKLLRDGTFEEAVLVSTCNRVEVIATTRNLEGAHHRLNHFFLRELGADIVPAPRSDVLYHHVDREAVRHLFRVAASLDSMVVGEPQILGQVKDAYRVASESGSSGAILNRLFANAFSVAKRVRSETEIASRPISVARVAVDLARQIFDELRGKHALLIGAGEMTELALEALREAGLSHAHVANRTREHAEALAGRFGASAHGLEELPERLREADIVLTSLAVEEPFLDRELVEEARRGRREPVFAIDLGVPRNIAPDVAGIPSVYL
jgi:glutamyl-tRNA reductase